MVSQSYAISTQSVPSCSSCSSVGHPHRESPSTSQTTTCTRPQQRATFMRCHTSSKISSCRMICAKLLLSSSMRTHNTATRACTICARTWWSWRRTFCKRQRSCVKSSDIQFSRTRTSANVSYRNWSTLKIRKWLNSKLQFWMQEMWLLLYQRNVQKPTIGCRSLFVFHAAQVKPNHLRQTMNFCFCW